MTHPMLTWLEAVLTEHERIAHKAQAASDGYTWHTAGGGDLVRCEGRPILADPDGDSFLDEHLAWHIVLHDPQSALATIAALRAILAIHAPETYPDCNRLCCALCEDGKQGAIPWPCSTVRALAAAFTHRPGYEPNWGTA